MSAYILPHRRNQQRTTAIPSVDSEIVDTVSSGRGSSHFREEKSNTRWGMSTEFQVERDREIQDGHILIVHTLVMKVDPLTECNGISRGISQMVLAKWWTRMEWSMSCRTAPCVISKTVTESIHLQQDQRHYHGL